MSTEAQQMRSAYARARKADPDSEHTRQLARELALRAIRERLAKLHGEDRNAVIRELSRPKEWA